MWPAKSRRRVSGPQNSFSKHAAESLLNKIVIIYKHRMKNVNINLKNHNKNIICVVEL